jgi:hypothetical protein
MRVLFSPGTILSGSLEKALCRHDAFPQGLKPPDDSIALMYRLKPVPFTETSFSAACKARDSFAGVMYGLEP